MRAPQKHNAQTRKRIRLWALCAFCDLTIYRRLRGRSGLPDAGFVVEVAGVGFGAAVLPAGAGFGAVVLPAGAVPVPLVPVLVAGEEVGGAAGNEVSGVGSGGNGFARMPAMSSFRPSVLSAFLNLYQPVRASCQTGFCAANFASVPASATARAYPSIMRSTIW